MATSNKNFKVKNGLDVNGDISSIASSGSEGGQINLAKPQTTSLSGDVAIDVFENKLRFFDKSGTNRGAYIDLTAAASSVGTNLLASSGSTGPLNYAQTVGTKQSAVSSAGTTIVSVSITTNGYPILVSVTGDVENSSAGGWTVLQLYRDSTAIGNTVHTEGSAGSENAPYSLHVIDTPSAGTYTYALKLNNSAGGTFNFGESTGPVITAVELSGPKGDTGASGLADIVSDTTPQLGGDLDAQGYDITNLNSVTLDTTPTSPGTAAGTIYWDSGDGIPKAVLNANVTIGLGQESIITVKNATGSTITKGTVVYINGAQGQMPTITLADADTEGTSSKTFGFAAEAIADGAEGFVVTEGILRGVNTDGFTEGNAIYLSTTAGQYTQTIPGEPAHMVFLGYAVKAHADAGEIIVKIQNGYELTELHGVTIANTAATNDILQLNSSGIWVNADLATANIANLASASTQSFTGNVSAPVVNSPYIVSNNISVYSGDYFVAISSNSISAYNASNASDLWLNLNGGNTYTGANLTVSSGLHVHNIYSANSGNKIYNDSLNQLGEGGGTTYFIGDGGGLSNVNASTLNGLSATTANTGNTIVVRNVSGDIKSNTLTILAIYDQATNNKVYNSATDTFGSGMGTTSFVGNGASLTSINAANITTGTISSDRLPLANATANGIVNISSQTFSGDKTFNNNISIAGNLTVTGTTTTVSATNLEISDPLIYIGTGNSGNLYDLGIVGHFTPSGGSYQHTGIVRDATDGTWTFFSNVTTEPTGNTAIDFTNAVYDTVKVGNVSAVTNVNATTVNVTGQLISTAATGTAPLAVTSTTKVANLNADLLDGYSSDTEITANTVVVRDSNSSISVNNINLGTGTFGNVSADYLKLVSGYSLNLTAGAAGAGTIVLNSNTTYTTHTAGTNNNTLATTAYVDTAVSAASSSESLSPFLLMGA